MIAALALMHGPAHAVAPTSLDGREPVRVFHSTPSGQAAFLRTARWDAFTAAEGKGWTARVDERTGTPHRLWGTGIDLGPVDSEVAVTKALDAFVERNAEMLGSTHPIALRSVGYDPDYDTWYVDYDVEIAGRPVWRGGLTFRIKHGRLVMAGADTYPSTPVIGDFLFGDPVSAAISAGLAPGAVHTDASVREVWLPREEDGLLELRAAYEVHTSTATPRGEWVTLVDGETGKLLATYNEVRHLTGRVEAEHDARFPGSGLEVSPVVGAFVSSDTETTLTGPDGTYELLGDAPASTVLQGNRLVLTDVSGDTTLDVPADGTVLWTEANSDLAAIDAWVFTQQVRAVWNEIVPNNGWTFGNTAVFVNISSSCNAYYDGTLNFFTAGSGCNNTGRLADVVYHEWGHGLHFTSLQAGFFDGALSEGAGDTVSYLMTGDNQLAPGFFTGGGFLRDVDNDRVYPDDVTGEVHQDGLIFAGSMWDTTQGIADTLGEAEALLETKRILGGLLKGGPGLDGALAEALVADDDDGDLGNGTPNECAIVAGFAAHGLDPVGSGGFATGHAPLQTALPDAPVRIEAQILGPTRCLDAIEASPTLTWRADDGEWQDTPLSGDGETVEGDLPAQPEGTFVEYYVTVPTSLGDYTAPTGAWRSPYSVYVGDTLEVHCDDFEANGGGYAHELIAGEPGDGADDWQHGRPRGQAGDPAEAFSGEKVWGNDLGRQDFNGEYQNNKHNRLTSPELALAHYDDPFLSYQRWLRVEDGIFDTASILVNGVEIWNNVDGDGQDHHLEDQWVPHAVPLQTDDRTVQIAFDLQSDGGLTMGGWTIDDVCIRAPATVNNRLGLTDFDADGEAGGIALSWTNPVHAPLEEVRVVRKREACPVDALDGDVVFYDPDPVVGAPIEVFDPTPSTKAYCYGVFPGDGADLLGFAVEGWNVDEAAASSRASRDAIRDAYEENGLDDFEAAYPELVSGGCGCASGGRGAVVAWFAGVLVLMRRR